MTGRRALVVSVLVGAAILLASGAPAWVRGRTADAVLGGGVVEASGQSVAPGTLGLALVAAAAVLGLLTGGWIARRVCAAILVLAALGSAVLVALVVADPSGALGRHAAGLAGRTGAVEVTAQLAPGVWVAVLGVVALLVGSVLGWRGCGRWSGLGSRYDRPEAAATDRGAIRSAWDEISEGRDPTAEPPAGATEAPPT
jgi:uncharacterized membrane protein (TIGR02234 family)